MFAKLVVHKNLKIHKESTENPCMIHTKSFINRHWSMGTTQKSWLKTRLETWLETNQGKRKQGNCQLWCKSRKSV